MGKLRCSECGQIFDSILSSCPNCDCPASECETFGNGSSDANVYNEKLGVTHGSYNEKTPYSPFSPDSSMFKDPSLLAKYPLGEFEKCHPFLGWLFGPWHLTCTDENSREQYNVINNLFYAFNLTWKFFVYPIVWTFLKTWLFLLIYLVLYAVLYYKSAMLSYPTSYYLILAYTIIGVVLYIYMSLVFLFGIGKSLHRYWPPYHKVWRRLWKRFVYSINN